jgi:hypothetical protein
VVIDELTEIQKRSWSMIYYGATIGFDVLQTKRKLIISKEETGKYMHLNLNGILLPNIKCPNSF